METDPRRELADHQARLNVERDGPEPSLLPSSIRIIAGCSQVSVASGIMFSAVQCLDLEDMRRLAGSWACWNTDFEYEAGYLAYREGPVVLKAIDMLPLRPDMLLVPASGIHHPRRMGMARHLGCLLSIPTIGVTERPLVLPGMLDSPQAFRPALGRGAVYVSPGWGHVDRDAALNLVARTMGAHGIPEPIHAAKVACRRIAAEWTSRVSSG